LEIVAPNGRIYFNEVEQKRFDSLRKPESNMPVNRYFADYMPTVEKPFPSVFLGDMTAKWIRSLLSGERILPTCCRKFAGTSTDVQLAET
jgi:hypothetical protein